MKRAILFAASLLLVLGATQAQSRFDNFQWSINAGTMTVPQASFNDLNGQSIALSDSATMLPMSLGVRCEREIIASDLLAWGWSLGAGVSHTGWNATIPASTPNVGNSGLTPDEDWTLDIPLLGLWGEAGAYGSLHLGTFFEFYGSLGFSALHYWAYGGNASSTSRTDEDAHADADEALASTLLGAYGLLGFKVSFRNDYFISLSARYTYGLNNASFDGLFNWDADAYSTRVTAPFSSDLSVMLGVGIMIE
ncbi:MAG: hypothetical protein IJ524_00240 [Bacteroidales bacterium]|nr:hypothetical protein [Bacteroidales bacterium]